MTRTNMRVKILTLLWSILLFYECIFVDLNYDAEQRCCYSLFSFMLPNNVLSQGTETIDPCIKFQTCNENKKQSLQRCYCDQACKLFDDCCFNVILNETLKTTSLLQNITQYLSCETEAFHNEYYGIMIVSKCPANYTFSEISENCRLANNIHPVTTDDGTTFRNVYCAYCHNVFKFQSWRFEYLYQGKCPDEVMDFNDTLPNKMKFVIENNCKFRFVPPLNARFRSCLKYAIRTSTNSSLCSEFQSPIEINNQLYRNVHCYDSPLTMRKSVCVTSRGNFQDQAKGYSGLVLTKIFNIRPVLAIFGQKICQENYIYDFRKDTCVPKICREGTEETCGVELLKNYKWRMSLNFVADNLIDIDFHLRFASFIYLSLPYEIYQINIENMRGFFKCGRKKADNNPCCVSNTHIAFSNRAKMTESAAKELEYNAINMKWVYSEIRNNTKISALDMYENTKFTDVCNTTGVFRTKIDEQSVTLRTMASSLVISSTRMWATSKQIPKEIEGTTVISEGSNDSRPEIRLKTWNSQYKNETNVTSLNSSLSSVNNDWSVGTILTYTTVGISSCFLLLTLCVYSYLGLFGSTSGVISKYMMVTMLAAQLVFIVAVGASSIKVICTVIGIISHYLWLGFFTWASVFLFSVLKMLRTLKTAPGALTQNRKLSKLTFCSVFMLPLVIVLPCVLLDIFSEVDVGYSEGGICFPTGSIVNFFCFTLPVVISLCINTVMLVITFVTMSRYNNTTLLLQPVRQTRSLIPTYIRLCVLCAFPWIIGIVADITQLEFFRYTYILLAGSHGTFVSLSFLLSKPVRRFVCQHFNDLQLNR